MSARGKLSVQAATAGMTDDQFDAWMRKQGAQPIKAGEKKRLQLAGVFMELPSKKQRRVA